MINIITGQVDTGKTFALLNEAVNSTSKRILIVCIEIPNKDVVKRLNALCKLQNIDLSKTMDKVIIKNLPSFSHWDDLENQMNINNYDSIFIDVPFLLDYNKELSKGENDKEILNRLIDYSKRTDTNFNITLQSNFSIQGHEADLKNSGINEEVIKGNVSVHNCQKVNNIIQLRKDTETLIDVIDLNEYGKLLKY